MENLSRTCVFQNFQEIEKELIRLCLFFGVSRYKTAEVLNCSYRRIRAIEHRLVGLPDDALKLLERYRYEKQRNGK